MSASLEIRTSVEGDFSGESPVFVECIECGKKDLPVQHAYHIQTGGYLCFFDSKSVCLSQYLNRIDDGEA